ncbi:kinase-like protein [Lactarius hatsudake]|nr:kinase-like protein [Lactarius hatsudake]
MSTEIAVPDVVASVNIDLHKSMSISSIASITSQPLLHSLGSHARPPPSLRLDDSAAHGSLLEGIPHARAKLDARQYKSNGFAQQLLDILRILRVPSWSQATGPLPIPSIKKVSGSLTNAVYFVSSPSSRTLLLRVYGPSSGSLISRPRELHVLHVLSSRYQLGPRIYGTFTNGRVEEYFDSVTLKPTDIREPRMSGHIGARMAELHSVDVAAVERLSRGSSVELGVRKNVHSWLPPARGVLALPGITPAIRKELDLDLFQNKWESYMKWLRDTRVDALPDHHQIIVVDFEYASPNPAAFDIANHFHEWTTNYHSSTPHVLDQARYPSRAERRTFFTAYLANRATSDAPAFADLSPAARERELAELEKTVRAWSPSSHAMWAAREDVQARIAQPEFDYVNYARCRMAAFYRELAALGL